MCMHTWWTRASGSHLNKAVVVCYDVTLFHHAPHILITLKEQFVWKHFKVRAQNHLLDIMSVPYLVIG